MKLTVVTKDVSKHLRRGHETDRNTSQVFTRNGRKKIISAHPTINIKHMSIVRKNSISMKVKETQDGPLGKPLGKPHHRETRASRSP